MYTQSSSIRARLPSCGSSLVSNCLITTDASCPFRAGWSFRRFPVEKAQSMAIMTPYLDYLNHPATDSHLPLLFHMPEFHTHQVMLCITDHPHLL